MLNCIRAKNNEIKKPAFPRVFLKFWWSKIDKDLSRLYLTQKTSSPFIYKGFVRPPKTSVEQDIRYTSCAASAHTSRPIDSDNKACVRSHPFSLSHTAEQRHLPVPQRETERALSSQDYLPYDRWNIPTSKLAQPFKHRQSRL